MLDDPCQAAVGFARAVLARFVDAQEVRGRVTGKSAFGVSRDEVVATLAEEPAGRHVVGRAGVLLEASLTSGPFAHLAGRFGLNTLDREIVALLLAPEVDHDLERVIAFALDDFTRKRPDVGFVARVLGGPDRQATDAVLRRFDESAPLRRCGIVETGVGDGPAIMWSVRLTNRIVAFLRGHDTVDELVHDVVRTVRAPIALADLVIGAELITRISRALETRDAQPRVLLTGPDGVGRALSAEAILAAAGRGSLRVDLAAIVQGGPVEARLAAALREAALRDRAAILEGDANPIARVVASAITRVVSDFSVPIVFTFPDHPPWLIDGVPALIALDVPPPTFNERLQLWQRALPSSIAPAAALETVASRYAFTGGTIARVAAWAAAAAALRDPADPTVTLDDLADAARHAFSRRLGSMAQQIRTGFTWDDLVLPPDTLDALKDILRFAHVRAFLLEDWGFAAKLPYGRGVSAILAGPPGTGKTMVAQLLARELGYDLYRIDLSQVVDKYVGETEKNLARVFDAAESSHAVLFFDEADALFAKRTDVKTSNDRYANLEVNYLLQRMESYDGVALLATNQEHGIDAAFKRRVRFTVQFELPEESERRALWRSMFPARVPLDPDIDWDALARKFEMAGGYIKKAALRAASIAAVDRRAVSAADLLEAAHFEYREMGRVI